MAQERVRSEGVSLSLEERMTVMAQKTLVEIQRKGGEVVERDDLGCRDVLSPDKTRIFRVSSEGDGHGFLN